MLVSTAIGKGSMALGEPLHAPKRTQSAEIQAEIQAGLTRAL